MFMNGFQFFVGLSAGGNSLCQIFNSSSTPTWQTLVFRCLTSSGCTAASLTAVLSPHTNSYSEDQSYYSCCFMSSAPVTLYTPVNMSTTSQPCLGTYVQGQGQRQSTEQMVIKAEPQPC